MSGQDGDKVVLVEVGKINKLVQMYPNYFGDVSLFVSNLKEICDGRKPVEYSLAKPQSVPLRPREPVNAGAIYGRYRKWFEKRS
ncbi:MAG: hypothetical protein E5V74_06465 [Mesorhizobium sp.]|nr:MAG: hypothetical protein E5W03_03730 [Mesorhizobium sp.]TIV23488.1 MAG: hypothetical protein E5W02_05715 [Mesorhizobium sp.]TIV67045.1 MAG: hypothetical protein E5V86_06300 [Mesorhizobium sp.]TIW04564.1 MAG: hypothetical protein E5V74_06465 [Mesorhizobium sp.]